MKFETLGQRMKSFEFIQTNQKLISKIPIIIRVDGSAFHTLTKEMKKPFDEQMQVCMYETAKYLCSKIQCAKIAYVQSDEISILLHNRDSITTEMWFGNEIQKICSHSSSLATYQFVLSYLDRFVIDCGYIQNETDKNNGVVDFPDVQDIPHISFDCKVFQFPLEEVCNYFIWRQQDAVRNSIQCHAQNMFSHNQLQNKNNDELQEMMFQKSQFNWNDVEIKNKRGVCCIKEETIAANTSKSNPIFRSTWNIDFDIPEFTKDRNYIERYFKESTK